MSLIISIGYTEIPYSREQGIFTTEQGIYFEEQGTWIGEQVRVDFLHTCFAALGRNLFSLSVFRFSKLLHRRRPLSPLLSPPVSPPISPVTYPSSLLAGPIVPRPSEGHRRRFIDADKQRILEEAARPGTSAAVVGSRYGIAQRVLRRWKQELAATASAFVTVHLTDPAAPSGAAPTFGGAVS